MAAWLIEMGLVDMAPAITALVPKEQGDKAFKQAILPDTYRIVITM